MEFTSVDLVDVLASNTHEQAVDAVWTTGDSNGGGRFDTDDLIGEIAANTYETTGLLLLVALIGVLASHRRCG